MIVKDIELVTFTKDLQRHDLFKEEETNFSVTHKNYFQEPCLFCELRNEEENNNCRPGLRPRRLKESSSDKVKSKAMMTLNRSVSSFTSYVDIDTGDNDDHSDDADTITPSLLDGEIVVTSGDRVALYTSPASG